MVILSCDASVNRPLRCAGVLVNVGDVLQQVNLPVEGIALNIGPSTVY